jgi:hypothetical protein
MKTKKIAQWSVIAVSCLGIMMVSGCAHPLTIRNLSSYRSPPVTTLQKPVTIGLVTDSTGVEERALLFGIANALGNYSAQVVLPYQLTSQKPVDVIAYVGIEAAHHGSARNFLVSFPGFVVFAPAWNGYIYEVKYTTTCTLSQGGSKETIDQFQLPIVLDIRHAGLNRTWTTGVDYLGGFGAASLVGGIFFTAYDDTLTPLLSETIENPIGKYVAAEIVKRLNAHGGVTQLQLRSGASEKAGVGDVP